MFLKNKFGTQEAPGFLLGPGKSEIDRLLLNVFEDDDGVQLVMHYADHLAACLRIPHTEQYVALEFMQDGIGENVIWGRIHYCAVDRRVVLLADGSVIIGAMTPFDGATFKVLRGSNGRFDYKNGIQLKTGRRLISAHELKYRKGLIDPSVALPFWEVLDEDEVEQYAEDDGQDDDMIGLEAGGEAILLASSIDGKTYSKIRRRINGDLQLNLRYTSVVFRSKSLDVYFWRNWPERKLALAVRVPVNAIRQFAKLYTWERKYFGSLTGRTGRGSGLLLHRVKGAPIELP